jgi:hypothetical protein
MKLSEAILLGSTVVTPKAGVIRSSRENAGCALGMAAIASGCTFAPLQRQIPVEDLRTVNVEDIWGPWLVRVVTRPCDCRAPITLGALRLKEITAYVFDRGSAPLPREMRIKDIIAHIFDHHCMGKRNWTLDQLASWVERWEPTDLAQKTLMAHASRRSVPRPQSHELSEDAAEWQKTCQAFAAKGNAKRRRGPSAR